MGELDLVKNLPMWFIMAYIIITYIYKAITNKDFLAAIRPPKPAELPAPMQDVFKLHPKMQEELTNLITKLNAIQVKLDGAEEFLIQKTETQIKYAYDVLSEVFMKKFKLEMYICVAQYLNDVDKWELIDLIKIHDDLKIALERCYCKSKEYLSGYKIYIAEFTSYNIIELLDKVLDVLKTNGSTSTRLKKKFIYEIIIS